MMLEELSEINKLVRMVAHNLRALESLEKASQVYLQAKFPAYVPCSSGKATSEFEQSGQPALAVVLSENKDAILALVRNMVDDDLAELSRLLGSDVTADQVLVATEDLYLCLK